MRLDEEKSSREQRAMSDAPRTKMQEKAQTHHGQEKHSFFLASAVPLIVDRAQFNPSRSRGLD